MKHECPMYLKSIGKSKAFAATLSDTEPEEDSDNEDDRILNAFTATVNPTVGLLKMWTKKKSWWSPNLKRWMIKMTFIQPMRNYTKFLKNMRNFIGWLPRNSVMWNLTVRNYPLSLMRLIRLLKH